MRVPTVSLVLLLVACGSDEPDLDAQATAHDTDSTEELSPAALTAEEAAEHLGRYAIRKNPVMIVTDEISILRSMVPVSDGFEVLQTANSGEVQLVGYPHVVVNEEITPTLLSISISKELKPIRPDELGGPRYNEYTFLAYVIPCGKGGEVLLTRVWVTHDKQKTPPYSVQVMKELEHVDPAEREREFGEYCRELSRLTEDSPV